MKWFGLNFVSNARQLGILLHSLDDATIATETIPPRLTIAIQDCTLCSGDLKVGTTDLDEWVVGVGVFPEGSTLEGDLSAILQARQIDS